MNERELVKALWPLRLAALERLSVFRGTPGAREAVRERLSRSITTASAGGELDVLWRGSRAAAYALWWYEENGWFKTPTTHLTFEVDPDDPEATSWLLGRLDAWAPELDTSADLMLDGRLTPLLAPLEARGFGIASALLVGASAPALARLVAAHDPPSTLDHLGLELRRGAGERDADTFVALKRRVFARAPEHCWFYGNPGFPEAEREALLANESLGAYWLVTDPDGATVGAFGASFSVPADLETRLFGPCAGLDLVLDPSIQGRGVVKTAYRLLLTEALARGCVAFKGGTSQPAVMHLGRTMGRELLALELRRGVPFDREHFGPVLTT